MDQQPEPQDTEHVPDTGDIIDPHAEDPTPAEVTDPSDPNWVEPAADARAVDPALLLPPQDPA